MKTHEKNYFTHDLELVPIVFVLKNWKNYINDEKFEVFSDHEFEAFLHTKKVKAPSELKDGMYRELRLLVTLSSREGERCGKYFQ